MITIDIDRDCVVTVPIEKYRRVDSSRIALNFDVPVVIRRRERSGVAWEALELYEPEPVYPEQETQALAITVRNCQRCGNTHEKMQFLKLNNPADDYEYYATCPDTRQPILLKSWVGEMPETAESDGKKC